ncbi:MAG TPA: aldo/keto reductase [Chloroflexota bacterium]|jgi:aryl-alcohol dehydrogenase-like predicted oxidoreductase
MQYRPLGRTGVDVSALCLGTVFYGSYVPDADALRIVHAALDRGINFFDTAEIYHRPHYGAAEELLGRALEGRRRGVVLATKKRRDPDVYRTGGPGDHRLSRGQIVAAVEGSLRRLRTDHIDLYYAHHPDPTVPIEESLRAFDDLVRTGKLRYVALSNYSGWQVVEALWIAERAGLVPIVGVQTLYNLLDRAAERELLPACARYGLAAVPYSPLAGGVLTAKYGRDGGPPPGSRAATFGHAAAGRPGHVPVLSQPNLAAAERVAALAAELGTTATRASLAWVLHQPAIASVIVGASSVGQLDENLTAFELALDAPALASLAAAADPPPHPTV